MMPNMRQALRGLGRRVSVQVIKQKVVDFEAVQDHRDLLRASVVLLPMPARKLMVKPEGQRSWKWWEGTSSVRLELGWFLRVDKDRRKVYEVMEVSDLSQARIYAYQFAEAPREASA
ncbi:MAG: hypothetical protein V4510_10080 [bacterium]